MRKLHDRTLEICNAILSTLKKAGSKGATTEELIEVLKSYFPTDWKADFRYQCITLYRHLREIRERGVDIDNARGKYVLISEDPILIRDDAHYFSKAAFLYIGKQFLPELDKYYFGVDIYKRVSEGLFIDTGVKGSCFSTILRCWAKKRTLLIDVKKVKKIHSYVVEPHGIISWKNEWYLAAMTERGVNYFPISKIIKAAEVEKDFEFNPGVLKAVIDLLTKEDK